MTSFASQGPTLLSGGPVPRLSTRQLDVLQYASEGLSIPETARVLGLAVGTVDYHRRVIVTALQARNIQHAIILACWADILDGRPQRHGDHAGYQGHLRRQEEPCDSCKAGEREYRSPRAA